MSADFPFRTITYGPSGDLYNVKRLFEALDVAVAEDQGWVEVEPNQLRTAIVKIATALFGGLDHASLKDVVADVPSVSPAGGARIISVGGEARMSENGAPYRPLRNTDYFRLKNNTSAPVSASNEVVLRSRNGKLEFSQNGRTGWRPLDNYVYASEWGVIADGTTDCTTQVQALFDWALAEIQAGRQVQIILPAGKIRCTGTVVLRGNGALSPTLWGGFDRGDNYHGGASSIFWYDGALGGTLFFTESVNACRIRNVVFDGNDKAKRVFVYSATTYADRSILAASNDLMLENCAIYDCQVNTVGACLFEWGTDPALTSNGHDTLEAADVVFSHVFFRAENPGAMGFSFANMKAAAIKNMSGGNAKIARADDCTWLYCHTAIDNTNGSAGFTVTNYQIADCLRLFSQGSGELIVTVGDCEAGNVPDCRLLDLANQLNCHATISGVEHVAFLAAAEANDEGVLLVSGGDLRLIGNYFVNGNSSHSGNPNLTNSMRIYSAGEYGANSSLISSGNNYVHCGQYSDGYLPVYDNPNNKNPCWPTPGTYGALHPFRISSVNDCGGSTTGGQFTNFDSNVQTLYQVSMNGPLSLGYADGGSGDVVIGTGTTTVNLQSFNPGSPGHTATLPTAVGKAGSMYLIKRRNSNGETLTLAAFGSETIDGASTFNLNGPYSSVLVFSDGANWQTFGGQFSTTNGDFKVAGQLGVDVAPSFRMHIGGSPVGGVMLGISAGLCTASDNGINIAGPTLTTLFQGWNAFDISASVNGNLVGQYIHNTDSAHTEAHSAVQIGTAGSGAGDPKIEFQITGVDDWSFGVDNSDSDKVKISRSGDLNNSVLFAVRTDGTQEFKKPYVLTSATALTAHAGGGQGSALALTAHLNFITTVASPNDSVKLLTPEGGLPQIVVNDGASAMDIYPQSGGQIDALGTNAPYSLAAGAVREFLGKNATDWRSR